MKPGDIVLTTDLTKPNLTPQLAMILDVVISDVTRCKILLNSGTVEWRYAAEIRGLR